MSVLNPVTRSAGGPAARTRTLHWLLALQSLVVILVSLNRLGPWTEGYVAGNEFLRWVDLHNMLTLPLLSLTGFYLVKRLLEQGRPVARPRLHLGLSLTFFVGVYLLGASYGDHELSNYLHARFCAEGAGGDLCRIVIFNDDEFSHWVFFIGFTLINGALLGLQAQFPWPWALRQSDIAWLCLNALFIGLGIFANLAFESIGLDLLVVASLALLAVGLLWRRGTFRVLKDAVLF